MRIPYEGCPLCEHKDGVEVCSADCTQHPLYKPPLPRTMRWLRCSQCEHVYVDGYFNEETLKLLLSQANPTQVPGFEVDRQRMLWAATLDVVSALYSEGRWFRSDGRWLDVGFGDGSLLTTAAEFGYATVGLDLREPNVQQMRKWGFEAFAIDLEGYREGAPFDVVSMMDVLEHIPFPKRALAHASTLLHPDGLLLLSMPNSDAFVWKFITEYHRNPYWGEIEHYHNFGRRRLYALLKECGFAPVRYRVSTRYVACMEVIARKAQ